MSAVRRREGRGGPQPPSAFQGIDLRRLAILAVLGYVGWKFGPPLADRWTLEHSTKAYIDGIPRNAARADIIRDLHELLEERGVRMDYVEIEVEDEQVPRRFMSISSPLMNWVEVTVRYSPDVHHPGIDKVTELDFVVVRRRSFEGF